MHINSPRAPPLSTPTFRAGVGFDPLKCSTYVDTKWLVEAEIKHGRVCMLATAGWVATDIGVRFPGDAYQGISSLAAHDAMVTKGDMLILFLVASTIEIFGGLPKVIQLFNLDAAAAPGDYMFDPLGLGKGPGLERMKLAEIKNGRLAMVAFSGIVTASALYGKPFPYF